MTPSVIFLALSSILFLSGCSGLIHPKAEEFYAQAKGATGQQTALALLAMMETSVQQAQTEVGESPGLESLHNQFHALHRTLCDFSEQQTDSPGYEHLITLNKELKTVFHRLWKFKGDAALRTIHLDLFLARIHELRTVTQSIQG